MSPKNKTLLMSTETIIEEINKSFNDEYDTSNIINLFWKTLRREHYETLSESVHGNYLYNISNSFKKNKEGRMIPSLSGGEWLDLEESLSLICLHQITLKRYFTWCLDLKHDIDLFDNANLLHKLIYFLDVVMAKKLMPVLILPMLKKE